MEGLDRTDSLVGILEVAFEVADTPDDFQRLEYALGEFTAKITEAKDSHPWEDRDLKRLNGFLSRLEALK